METKGQISKNSEENSQISGFPVNFIKDKKPLIEDKRILFLSKKTEKLISAIYLITDLMSDKEPIKWCLREQSLKLIPTLSFYKGSLYQGRKRKFKDFETTGLELFILLETACYSGLISNMNFSILYKELESLEEQKKDHTDEFGGGQTDTPDQFDLEESFFNVESVYKGQSALMDTKGKKEEPHHTGFNKGQVDLSKGHLKEVKKQDNKQKIPDGKDSFNFLNKLKKKRKNERQMAVIDLIKNKGSVSIKDISESIKDCSEKTIQRELIFMVKTGVLKKVGERRWSKYSLNL